MSPWISITKVTIFYNHSFSFHRLVITCISPQIHISMLTIFHTHSLSMYVICLFHFFYKVSITRYSISHGQTSGGRYAMQTKKEKCSLLHEKLIFIFTFHWLYLLQSKYHLKWLPQLHVIAFPLSNFYFPTSPRSTYPKHTCSWQHNCTSLS